LFNQAESIIMKLFRILPFILSLAGLTLTLAGTETLPVYAGFGYGVARYTGATVDDPLLIAGQKAEGDRGYYELYVGIDLNEIFSIEGGYAKFGSVEESYNVRDDIASIVSPNDTEKVDYKRYTLMAVAEYPLTLGFAAYATGGYAYYEFDRSFFGGFSPSEGETETAEQQQEHGIEYGLGVKWEILSRVSVRGQWSQSMIGDASVQSNRLSVEFHF
jgi:opacity protein-like surface antigen